MQTNNENSPDETNTIPPVIPSPKKRQYKRNAGICRYNRKYKKRKQNTLPRASSTQRRSSLGLVNLQSSGDELDLDNGYHVAPVSMDEYLAIHNSDRVFFGTNHSVVRNLAISYMWKNELGSPGPSYWGGKHGTISVLCTRFRIPKKKKRQVKRVLEECLRCSLSGDVFDGRPRTRTGRPPLIDPWSEDEEIITDWIEQGLGFRYTTLMVNEHRTDLGRLHVSRSAVVYAFRWMAPVITNISKRMQGNTNNTAWLLARHNQTKQYMIMLG